MLVGGRSCPGAMQLQPCAGGGQPCAGGVDWPGAMQLQPTRHSGHRPTRTLIINGLTERRGEKALLVFSFSLFQLTLKKASNFIRYICAHKHVVDNATDRPITLLHLFIISLFPTPEPFSDFCLAGAISYVVELESKS